MTFAGEGGSVVGLQVIGAKAIARTGALDRAPGQPFVAEALVGSAMAA